MFSPSAKLHVYNYHDADKGNLKNYLSHVQECLTEQDPGVRAFRDCPDLAKIQKPAQMKKLLDQYFSLGGAYHKPKNDAKGTPGKSGGLTQLTPVRTVVSDSVPIGLSPAQIVATNPLGPDAAGDSAQNPFTPDDANDASLRDTPRKKKKSRPTKVAQSPVVKIGRGTFTRLKRAVKPSIDVDKLGAMLTTVIKSNLRTKSQRAAAADDDGDHSDSSHGSQSDGQPRKKKKSRVETTPLERHLASLLDMHPDDFVAAVPDFSFEGKSFWKEPFIWIWMFLFPSILPWTEFAGRYGSHGPLTIAFNHLLLTEFPTESEVKRARVVALFLSIGEATLDKANGGGIDTIKEKPVPFFRSLMVPLEEVRRLLTEMESSRLGGGKRGAAYTSGRAIRAADFPLGASLRGLKKSEQKTESEAPKTYNCRSCKKPISGPFHAHWKKGVCPNWRGK